MTNIILCGGNGTRLWPISRSLMPKQFVKLFDNQSLFQLTASRNAKVCDKQFVVSNREQYFLALDQLDAIGLNNGKCLLEPVGRNTAAAIALACLALDKNEIVLVTPSDHIIKNQNEYEKVINRAKELANEDFLVTFGITPSYPETGFGYIEAKGEDVKRFVEKPDEQTAQKYLKDGNYYWNSGMFCFKAGVFLEELKKYTPKIYETSSTAYNNASKEDLIRISKKDMLDIPEDSIDYAVMERSNKVKVIKSDISWSDLGSFDALSEELDSSETININSNNNLVLSEHKTVSLIDVDDLIVVDTSDALLISKKGSSQKVKQIVNELKKRDSHLPNIHLKAHRPWGTYTVFEDRPGFKIKRLTIYPGKRLSLQRHQHRNEHWVVVEGTATVTLDDKVFDLPCNESTYIKQNQIHRLENKGSKNLIIIETQVGSYTGEDDIERLEDDFKRIYKD